MCKTKLIQPVPKLMIVSNIGRMLVCRAVLLGIMERYGIHNFHTERLLEAAVLFGWLQSAFIRVLAVPMMTGFAVCSHTGQAIAAWKKVRHRIVASLNHSCQHLHCCLGLRMPAVLASAPCLASSAQAQPGLCKSTRQSPCCPARPPGHQLSSCIRHS